MKFLFLILSVFPCLGQIIPTPPEIVHKVITNWYSVAAQNDSEEISSNSPTLFWTNLPAKLTWDASLSWGVTNYIVNVGNNPTNLLKHYNVGLSLSFTNPPYRKPLIPIYTFSSIVVLTNPTDMKFYMLVQSEDLVKWSVVPNAMSFTVTNY